MRTNSMVRTARWMTRSYKTTRNASQEDFDKNIGKRTTKNRNIGEAASTRGALGLDRQKLWVQSIGPFRLNQFLVDVVRVINCFGSGKHLFCMLVEDGGATLTIRIRIGPQR